MKQTSHSEIVNSHIAKNVEDVVCNGPRLSYAHGIVVLAKDTAKGKALLGGLGSMGVGQMWFTIRDHVADYPGFAEAPEVSCQDK